MLWWNQGPSLDISFHIQEVLNFIRRLYVIHTVALHQGIGNWLVTSAHCGVIPFLLLILVFVVLANASFRYGAAGHICKQRHLMAMLQVVLLCADSTSCLASWNLFAIGKEIPSRARSTVLLEASEVLNDESFFLCRDRSGASFSHQMQHPFPVFVFTCMVMDFVPREVSVVGKIRIAQLAHQRTTDNRLVSEAAQLVSCYLCAWNVSDRPSARCRDGLHDALRILFGKLRMLRCRIVDKLFVLLQTFQQWSSALSACKDQQVLV